jgi:hypothetical protein
MYGRSVALAGKTGAFADFFTTSRAPPPYADLMQQHDDWRVKREIPGIIPALIVIGIGVVFLLNNLNIFDMHDIWRFWPVILIAAGLAKMVDSPYNNGRLVGGVLIGVGGLFLADTLGFLNLSWRDSGRLRSAPAC